MKETPIIFSTPMVQAILDGNKTQTRRILKEPFHTWFTNANNAEWKAQTEKAQCPYGQVGDLLWVRETFYKSLSHGGWRYMDEVGAGSALEKASRGKNKSWKKTPSIHMPKAAARIWLRITDVRAERLQNISEEDAISEGIERNPKAPKEIMVCYKSYISNDYNVYPCVSFSTLWQLINGRESWDQNPWVWVVSFEVVSKTGKP